MTVARLLDQGRCLWVSPQSWLHFSVTVCLNLLFLYLFICTFVVFSWVHFFFSHHSPSSEWNLCFCCFVLSIKCWLRLCFKYCLFFVCVCVCVPYFTLLNLVHTLAICRLCFELVMAFTMPNWDVNNPVLGCSTTPAVHEPNLAHIVIILV